MAEHNSARQGEFRTELLRINIWAMLLVIALVLERSSGVVVALVDSPGDIDPEVWGAVGTMGFVFGALLGTTVGILVVHVYFDAPYGYWMVVLDNVLVSVPLYVAVRFMASSIDTSASVTLDSTLEFGQFRIGALLIAFALLVLFFRDLVVNVRYLGNRLNRLPIVLVAILHLTGAVVFACAAIDPALIIYVTVLAFFGLAVFFAGMMTTRKVDSRFGMVVDPAVGSL